LSSRQRVGGEYRAGPEVGGSVEDDSDSWMGDGGARLIFLELFSATCAFYILSRLQRQHCSEP